MLSEDEIKSRLIPGPELPEDPNLWKLEGKCDGIFYLGQFKSTVLKRDDTGSEQLVESVVIPSNQREALRYLKPAPEIHHTKYPGRLGVLIPSVGNMIPKDLAKRAKKLEVAVRYHFTDGQEHTVNAAQQEYFDKYIVRKINDSLYVAIYTGEIDD